MVEQDFLMRMIKDSVKFLGKILLGKDAVSFELAKEGEFTKVDELYVRLHTLITSGEINEAENLLWESLDKSSDRYKELALDFYQELAELDSGYLEEHDFSKEEVQEGLRTMAQEFGITM